MIHWASWGPLGESAMPRRPLARPSKESRRGLACPTAARKALMLLA
jgi:hypothetical protein